MGFAWSSYIAQSTMNHVCYDSGLSRDVQLSDDLPSPLADTVFGLATDDVVILSKAPLQEQRQTLVRLDRSFARTGVQQHTGKNVDCVLTGSAVGVDLVDGIAL